MFVYLSERLYLENQIKRKLFFLNFPAASKAHLKKETVLFIRALYRLENRAAIFRVPLLSKGVSQGHRGEIDVMPLFFHGSYKVDLFSLLALLYLCKSLCGEVYEFPAHISINMHHNVNHYIPSSTLIHRNK